MKNLAGYSHSWCTSHCIWRRYYIVICKIVLQVRPDDHPHLGYQQVEGNIWKKNVPFSFLHFMLSAFFLSCASTKLRLYIGFLSSWVLWRRYSHMLFSQSSWDVLYEIPSTLSNFAFFLVHDIKYIGHPGHPRKGLDLWIYCYCANNASSLGNFKRSGAVQDFLHKWLRLILL